MAKKSNVLHKDYASNVFINCPFDTDYQSIFYALIFTIADCGFIPRCALEKDGSDDIRIEKIMSIIQECKYGIHDICRTELDQENNLPRFNMPLELGIFIGCKKYLPVEKSYIILDKERFRYQKFISDLAGQDICSHRNQSKTAIEVVRNYLHNKTSRITIPSGTIIDKRFKTFNRRLPVLCRELNWDINNLTFMEYYSCIKAWLNLNTLA